MVDAVGDRQHVVVVGQSLGCFTAPLVCEQVAAELLILLAPMIPAPGDSPASYWVSTGYDREDREHYDDPIDVFYQDLPRELAAEALSKDAPSPKLAWANGGRSTRGPRSRRAFSLVAKTAFSWRASFAALRENVWESLRMRSTAGIVPR